MDTRTRPPLVLVGPTASGKSSLAVALARSVGNAEVVSADAMAVYRKMDIGTAKPTKEDQHDIAHHLIDVVNPEDDYTMAQFQRDVHEVLPQIKARGNVPIVVGGTGLYVQAVVDNFEVPGSYPEVRKKLEADPDAEKMWRQLATLDAAAAAKMEPTNHRRIVRALEVCLGSGRPFSSYGPGVDAFPPTEFTILGLDIDRSILDERIDQRFDDQLAQGWLAEVESLRGARLSRTAARALGYGELFRHLDGELSLDEAVTQAKRRTRRFARRQQRWFRRDPRIVWLEVGGADLLSAALEHWPS